MTSRDIPIAGMTCAACEETVSATLAALDGVDDATASARKGVVTLTGTALPADAAVARALNGTPYSLGSRPWLSRERTAWRDAAVGLGVVAVVGVVLLMWDPSSRLGTASLAAGLGTMALAAVMGVAASVSSCIAVVGGLVLSLSAAAGSTARSVASAARPHLAFNAGRIVGFAALGALTATLGSTLSVSGPLLTVALCVVAVATGILGVRLMEVSPRIAAWQLTLPASWARWARADRSAPAGVASVAAMGAATYFLPCAFTQVAQMLALTSGSAVAGAGIMGAFAVGTTPGLMAAGLLAARSTAQTVRTPLRILGVVMVGVAAWTASSALMGAGLGGLTPATPTERTANVAEVNGVQEVSTIADYDGYSPRVTVIYANEPVTWTITPESFSCANLIDAPSLGLERIAVLADPVSVTFTVDEPGTYDFACAMGMYDGTFVVVDRPADTA